MHRCKHECIPACVTSPPSSQPARPPFRPSIHPSIRLRVNQRAVLLICSILCWVLKTRQQLQGLIEVINTLQLFRTKYTEHTASLLRCWTEFLPQSVPLLLPGQRATRPSLQRMIGWGKANTKLECFITTRLICDHTAN